MYIFRCFDDICSAAITRMEAKEDLELECWPKKKLLTVQMIRWYHTMAWRTLLWYGSESL